MPNLSQFGNKKIIGGFVDNRRIMEECIYFDKIVTSVRNIPYVITVDGVDFTTLNFVEIGTVFNVLSIDKSTRKLTFDYDITLRYNKAGTPPKNNWYIVFTTGNYSHSDSIPVIQDTEEGWYELLFSDNNVTATYSTSEWNALLREDIIQEKKIIYQHIPHTWRRIDETTYDYESMSYDDFYNTHRPCEVYKNKVVRITVEGQNSRMWEEIETPIIWRSIPQNEVDGTPINVSSGANPPHFSYLPSPKTLAIGKCGIVHDDTYTRFAYYRVDFGDASVTAYSDYVEPYVIALPSAFDYTSGTIGRVYGKTGRIAYYRVLESGTGITYYYYKCIPI